MKMTKEQILDGIITGLDSIPKPREGKTLTASLLYTAELREAFRLARQVQQAYSVKEMREAYEVFDAHIKKCVNN